MEGCADILKLLIETRQLDVNATDKVSHIMVTYELYPLKYDIINTLRNL